MTRHKSLIHYSHFVQWDSLFMHLRLISVLEDTDN